MRRTFLFALAVLFSSTHVEATEIERKAQEFQVNSGHYAGCWVSAIDSCTSGLDKLLSISTSEVFPNENFDEIYITDRFQNTVSDGFVLVDYRATASEIKAHLLQQSNHLREMQQKRDSFHSATGHFAGCWLWDIDSCISALDKLAGLRDTGIFNTEKFDEIYITNRFQDVNADGYVLIDHQATAAEMEAHLRRQ